MSEALPHHILKHEHHTLLGKVVLEHIVFRPPFRAPGDMQNEACFLYLAKGESKLHGPQESLDFSSDQAVVMKCGNYLNAYVHTGEDEPNEAFAVHFYPDVLREVFDDRLPAFLVQRPGEAATSVERVVVDAMMTSYITSLQFYFENPGMVTEELIKLKVKELILLLVNTDENASVRLLLKDLFSPERYAFKSLIETHLFSDLTLEELAFIAGLSLASFKRKFRAAFGSSPGRYIKSRRLEKSKQLLGRKELRISDVAYDCGFNDLGHFSKSFIAAFGLSPSDYRRNLS